MKDLRYILHESLGTGGMGSVSRATDRLTGTVVALKQISLGVEDVVGGSNHSASPEALRLALAQEFKILATLTHPNIIRVLDYGFEDDTGPYFTMDYLPEAETIVDAGRRLNLEGKLNLIEQLLTALIYLHRRGIWHKDIKPSNVLVVDGMVQIVDFGLSSIQNSQTDTMGGTMAYAAPELVEDGKPYSFSADLYSVGVIAYELIADRHPFYEDFDCSLLKVDSSLAQVIEKMLAENRMDRFSSAQFCFAAVREALGKPIPTESYEIRESFLQAAKFVGREAEIEQLSNAVFQAKEGTGSAWLIGGESGVGKSRLIREIQTLALVNGMQVLKGQGLSDGGVPFQFWRETLRQLIVTLPEIDDLSASVLLPVVPSIEQLIGRPVSSAAELDREAGQLRLIATIAQLFMQAPRPILLILEDLHWAVISLRPLIFLTRLIAEHRLVIIGSYRNDEHSDLPSELSEMQLLELGRLNAAELKELSGAMLGDAGNNQDVLELIERETEGNTFFAVEVVRALAEKAGQLGDIGQMELPQKLLPNGILDIVHRRLRKIPAENYDLLIKAAVAGRVLELPLISYMAGTVNIEADWLPQCADSAILELQDGIWQFCHGKIRDGIVATLPKKQLKSTHRELAEAIIVLYPKDQAQAIRLAYHWGAAGHNVKAARAIFAAGEYAVAQFAHDEAVKYFSHALSLTDKKSISRQYEIVSARQLVNAHTGRHQKEAEDLLLLEALTQKLDQPRETFGFLLNRAKHLLSRSELSESLEVIREAAEVVKEENSAELLPQAWMVWAAVLEGQGNYQEAIGYAQSSLDFYQSTSDFPKELADAFLILAKLSYRQEYWDQAVTYAREAIILARQTGDRLSESRALNVLGIVNQIQKRESGTTHYYAKSLSIAQEIGAREQEMQTLNLLLAFAIDSSEYEQAETYFGEINALALELNSPISSTVNLANMALTNLLWGRLEEARQQFEASLQIGIDMGNKYFISTANALLGRVYSALGERALAHAANEKALPIKRELNQLSELVFVLNNQGYLALDQQEWGEATSKFQESLKISEEIDADGHAAEANTNLAFIHIQNGDLEQAKLHLENAVTYTLFSPLTGYWEPFKTALSLHKMLIDLDDDNRADTILERAYMALQKRADKFTNPDNKCVFLESFEVRREIVRLYEKSRVLEEPDRKVEPIVAVPPLTHQFSESHQNGIAEINGAQTKKIDTVLDGYTEAENKAPVHLINSEELLKHLLAVSRQMAEIRSIEPLLLFITNQVISLVGAERGYVVFIGAGGTLDFRVKKRADGTDITSNVDAVSQSVLEQVVQTQNGIVIRNALLDPRFNDAKSVVAMRLRSIICVPLITKDRVIGAIYVENRTKEGRFSADDLATLEFFGNHAAVTIDNANLNENLEHLVEERTQELKSAKDAAEFANVAKTTFLSNMTHELRTPLNAILNFSGFVFDRVYGDINSDQELALQRVMDSGEHLLSLINDVLDINKIEAGMMNPVFEEVDVNKLLKHIISTAEALIKNKPIELVIGFDEAFSSIQADRRRVRQIFLNLISNAVKYTDSGSIKINVAEEESSIMFSIQDTGIGIAEKDYDLVFETFLEARHNLENVISTGLGLPIAKHLVELHGGKIWFESKLNSGSSFFVRLPKVQVGF